MYEYECRGCGYRFEQIRKFSDPPIEVCPQCGERKVEKLLSSPAIQFKGSGWYITDYARKGQAGADGGEKSKTDDNSPKTDDKAAKPATESKTSSSETPAPSTTAKDTKA